MTVKMESGLKNSPGLPGKVKKDKKRKKGVESLDLILKETNKLLDYVEADKSDSYGKSKAKKQKKLKVNEVGGTVVGDDTDDWVMRPVSGVDLVSKKAVVTNDGKHILINSTDKVLVYSSSSGQLVRQLDTGNLLAVQPTASIFYGI